MIKRIYSSLLALVMVVGLLPATAFAAVTSTNDWDIFKADDTYNLPETQEQLLTAMIQDSRFANAWAPIVNNILPNKFVYNCRGDCSHEQDYTDFTSDTYKDVKYTERGMRNAIETIIKESDILNGSNVLNSLPEGDSPVYYVFTRAEGSHDKTGSPRASHGYGYYIQLFYDFEIEGIKDKFTSPFVEDDDTEASLAKKGYRFSLGGSSDSYKVTAENRNDFENTVEKSYTYEKSTSTSTTVSNTYSQNWTEETTIGVEFSVPVLASLSPTAKVEQSFSYSYGMEKTYESSKEETYSQSISDTISVPLPAHTGIDINVDVKDMTTTIPYKGAVHIKYKTKILSVTGYEYSYSHSHDWYGREYKNYTFGRNGKSAIEDLDARIQNRGVSGYDPDGLDMKNLYENNTAFSGAADTLRSGQPVAPYFGDFHYTSKNTIITPQQVYPIYALDRLVPDTENITLYEQQDMRLDSIKVQALDEYDVAWYGFNPRLSGEWTVVDEDGNDASEYAEITKNKNGYPLLQALKPNDGKELFLRYEPKSSIDTTDAFNSELIELTIKPVKLSEVTLAGEFDTFYLNDGNNEADVSNLTVTAKDEDGNDFDVTNKVKWYAEETDGITVNETTGEISFTKAGTYQIYAVVNGTESNRVALQVLPERYLDTLIITGTIPDLIYDDDTANTFDLSKLDVDARDQYGEDMFLYENNCIWKLASDKGYAEIDENDGTTITGLVVGTDTVTLSYPIGTDGDGKTIYKTSQPVTVKVIAKPYVNELYYNGGAPAAVEGVAYNLAQIPLIARNQHGDPIAIPQDIEWKLAENNQTAATIEHGMLTVAAGQVPDASYADVILEAYSPSIEKTAKNVVLKVEQQPVLKSIKATMNENFILRLDENAKLADHFSAVGYDQYGREMQGVAFTWHTSKRDVVSLENGTLKALKEDSTEIYATAEGIESNRITLTVTAPRRLTGISVSGVSSTAAKNTTLDLTKAVVKTVDQFGKEFNSDELAAYPASIRWTLEKNDTNAVIDGNTLSFGDKDGKMTLICAAVNTDTNVIVEKRIDIQIGGSSSSGGSSGGGGGGGGGGGTAKSAYMITVENTKNGEVISSHKTADKGDTVTLTATPDKGYAVRRIIVTDSSDQKLTLTEKDGKYTFTMPASNVTVKTTFIMDKSKDEVPNPFEDVSANSYYYDAVRWAVKNGTTGGTSATTFSPDAPCTRAQAVTFLWRAAGSPAPSSTEMPFADVPADAYYYNAVLWAVENGITGGTSATTFSPDAPCSRGQIVAFLWRSKQSPKVAAENPFMDVNAADYYHDAVLWAAENGITGGTGANTFSPNAPCTRAQIVTFLYRALHK